jgi:hypothetical protein
LPFPSDKHDHPLPLIAQDKVNVSADLPLKELDNGIVHLIFFSSPPLSAFLCLPTMSTREEKGVFPSGKLNLSLISKDFIF